MPHIKQKIYNWKGECIGEETIHRPYHKPYNRLNQKKLTKQIIYEQIYDNGGEQMTLVELIAEM